ncbi:MAG TPA: ABC transporter permease, partial [Gaiellaceae bacterium]|nr:ABC transporter permease [Gaiellaceae bacterium]
VSSAARRFAAELEVVFAAAVLLALGVALTFESPYFLTSQNISNLLEQAAVLAIVAFGMTAVIVAGHFDLSVGSGVALVGVVAALTMINTESIVLGVLAGIGAGCGIGLVNGIVVTVFRVPSFIATLAMLVIARGAALAITDGQTQIGFPEGLASFITSTFLGLRMSVWLALAVLVFFFALMRYTRLGVQLYAVGGNATAARLSGLPVGRVQTAAFVLSGFAVGVAGIVLVGRLDAAQPSAGALLELFAVAAVVIGGTSLYGGQGSVIRTVVGVALIAVIQNGLTLLNVNSDIQNVILGGVFIAATLSGVVRSFRR